MSHIIHSNDIFVWPDGTWCFRCDACDEAIDSDPGPLHRIIYFDTPEWEEFSEGWE